MPVAVLAPDGERQRLQQLLRKALLMPVHGAGPEQIDGLVAHGQLRVLVAYHGTGFDGLGAARELLHCRPDVGLVLLAAGGDEALAVEAMKAGAADYLPAGRAEELPGLVRRLLQGPPRVAVQQALRDTEASLLLALRAARIGAWEWDLLSGRARSLNAAEAVGLPEVANDFPAGLGIVHPDDREAARARLESIARGEGAFPLEFRVATPDGSPRWAYLTGHVELAAGRPVFARGVVMDITSPRQAEARYVRGRRHEALGLLAGSIAHDLNNVLAPIQLSVDLLREGPRSASTQAALLDNIARGVERGTALLGQVLDFARGRDNDLGPVRLGELLATATLQLSPTLPAEVRLEASAEPGLALVRGDERQLIQALCHLVSNAVEAMPGGGTIAVRAANVEVGQQDARSHPGASAGPHVLLTVCDTGPGIPPEVLDHVFDPFFTTKPRERHPGLGLAVVRGVVRRHGGFVDADTLPAQGARVRIWLPAASGAVPPGGGQARLVLLADDGPASLQAGRLALEQAGFRALTASNGPEALLAHHRQMGQVAIAVVAASLPILDGPATLRALRRADSSIPLVLLTRGDPPPDSLDELGRVAWLQQPFTPDSLVSVVRAALEASPSPPSSTRE